MPNRPTALIIGKSLITAETIAQELRARLTEALGDLYRYLPAEALLEHARRILAEFEPILAENVAAADLAGWISGFDDVAKKLPAGVDQQFLRIFGGSGPPRPPKLIIPGGDEEPILRFPLLEKAAESLIERNILTRAQFDRADDEARANAFTVAGNLSTGTIEAIRDVLVETIEAGPSLREFEDRLGPKLESSFIGPGHLETVFRTNIQQAFHDGHDQLASHPVVAEVFPYQAYLAIHDGRVDPQHLALESYGIEGSNIYRRSDPFWWVFRPPWRQNCRCSVNLMTVEAAARAGLSEAQEWLRTGIAPPAISRLPFIPFRPAAGWGRAA